jgi:hypothetical protein
VNMQTRTLVSALALLIAALGGFYAGYKLSQSRQPTLAAAAQSTSAGGGTGGARAAAGGGGGAAGQGQRGAGRNLTTGSITQVGDGFVVVHDRATGKDVKVTLGSSTRITKTVSGAPSDLQKDVTVAVQGSTGSDGTVSATGITVVPAGAGGFLGGGGFGGGQTPRG